jgi:hypothetical protein
MKRREFGFLLSAAVSWPLVAFARQPRRAPRIGVLLPGPPATYVKPIAEFRRGLGERGYTEPQTLGLILRYSGSELERLPMLARELVSADVDIIVTSATPAVLAAMGCKLNSPNRDRCSSRRCR